MTNLELKKHGIFEKTRKDKREINVGYHTIGDSRTSLDASSIVIPDIEQKLDDNFHGNVTVNLKKSKTFKIMVNKKPKEKEKGSKIESFKKPKNKKRKRKEIKTESFVIEPIKEVGLTRPIFGVSLKEACKNSKSHDGYPLPAFFRQCINYLETDNRLSFEGIYRIPGVNSQIVKLKQLLNTDSDIDKLLSNFDIAVITSVVKSFLRDLKPELIEKSLEASLFKALDQHKENMQDKVGIVKNILIQQLPEENQYLLALIISHMGKVIDMSNQNKMSLENLLIVLSPALHLHFGLLKMFYDHSSDLFSDLQAPVYVPPVRPGPEYEEELPETVEGINEELKKQVSYLDDLHEQINEGFETKNTEYLIWEVQLIVTKLKRKKYIAELNDPELIKVELKKYERQLEKLHKDMLETVNNTSATATATVSAVVVSNSTGGSISANNIVDQASSVGAPSTADQELWQIQRTITTLNRKLKSLTTYSVPRFQTEPFVQMGFGQKVENINDNDDDDDDDDDDSVQLNLTLRKLPRETPEIMEDEINNVSEKDVSPIKVNESEVNTTPIQKESNDTEGDIYVEVISDEMVKSSEEKTSDWLMSEDPQQQQEARHENATVEEQNIPNDKHLAVSSIDIEQSVSSNGMNHTTEDDNESNSESELTGSNIATCIDDLIQTGEMWTNEKEQLLSEDDDLRNESLRYLYMREELISIKNDLKTRLTSEANEIARLKRNIESLEEEKSQKTFSVQNQYRKLNESSSSPENRDDCEGEDNDEDNDESEDEEDDPDDSSHDDCSEPMQYSDKIIVGRGGGAEDCQEDIADLLKQQQEIMLDNERLEKDNMDLLEQIQLERNHCIELKVALRTHMLLACPSPWPSNIDE